MNTEETTVALVGACGGTGATRLSVEVAATLARDGRDVAVVDVAFATQGLAGYVPGRIDPDVTRALLDEDVALADALVAFDWGTPGRAAACPARAAFERVARAQAADASRSLPGLLAAAGERFDVVLVDVPPIATNQAVAAVTATDRIGLVVPPGERGVDALQRVRGRLADVGVAADAVVINDAAGVGAGTIDADAVVPESGVRAPSEAPACLEPDAAFAPAVAAATAATTGASPDLSFPDSGLLDGLP